MLFTKKKTDGSVPLKYKRGKIKKGLYRSECFGYAVKIPDDLDVKDTQYCESISDPKNIYDFFGITVSNVSIGAIYVPQDGDFKVEDDKIRDMLGNAIVQKMNQQKHNRGETTYYGLTEFCGKTCIYTITHFQKNGMAWVNEIYGYMSTYYTLQFSFVYPVANKWSVDEAKALFSALPGGR